MQKYLTPQVRRWAYGVGIAATGFLGIKGVVSADEQEGLNLLLSAVLGMAFLNVPEED
jgi:hypothetical protein